MRALYPLESVALPVDVVAAGGVATGVVAAGGDVDEVVAAAMVSFRADVRVLGALSASVTVMLKEKDPAAAGVPLILPLLDRTNPAGKEPEVRLQV